MAAVLVGATVVIGGCSDDSDSDATVEAASATPVPWSGTPADGDTVMVYGTIEATFEQVSSETGPDGVETVELAYSETLEMSDPRASGTGDYTVTLHVPDTSVGGTWVVEEYTIANDDGGWVGYGEGAYIYRNKMPDALTANQTVIIGDAHFTGTGDYEGLRLHLHFSSDGAIGTLRPAE